MTTVGRNIRRIREMRGLTQSQLASLVGYNDRSTIAKVETGINDVTTETVAVFAKALKVSPMVLFMDDCEFEELNEFLPYLASADETTRNNIRAILGMKRV